MHYVFYDTEDLVVCVHIKFLWDDIMFILYIISKGISLAENHFTYWLLVILYVVSHS